MSVEVPSPSASSAIASSTSGTSTDTSTPNAGLCSPANDAPIPEPAPQDSTDTIRQNPTDSDGNSPFSLPIFTPGHPQPDLTPRQLAALALLTSGKTVSATASMLKVHRSTIHAWSKIPAFAAELESRRAELRETIDARLYRILLHATHACIASLKVKDVNQSHRNAFRLMSTMRPWMPRIDALLDHPPKEYADNNRAPKPNDP